jgi:hypothetical protein
MSLNKKVTSPTIMKRKFKQSWSAIPPISTKRTIASLLTLVNLCKNWQVPNTNDESRTRLGELQVSLYLTIIESYSYKFVIVFHVCSEV